MMDEAGVWDAVLTLAEHRAVTNIGNHPGCWEERIDDAWWFAVNPQLEDVTCSSGATVPAGTIYVTYHGWPAALLALSGEGTFAAGEGANPAAFRAAIAASIAQDAIPGPETNAAPRMDTNRDRTGTPRDGARNRVPGGV